MLEGTLCNWANNLLIFSLTKLPFFMALGCEHWHSKLFSFSKWNRKEEQVVWETIPGKQHKNVQNTLTNNVLQQLPPLPCFCRRNFNVWKNQPVQRNRHFQWKILLSLPVIKIFTFVCSTFLTSFSECFKRTFILFPLAAYPLQEMVALEKPGRSLSKRLQFGCECKKGIALSIKKTFSIKI